MSEQKASQTSALPAWLVLSIPLLACLSLFYSSLSEPFSKYGVYDGKRLMEVSLFPVLILITLLLPDVRSAFARALHAVGRPVAIAFGLFLLIGLISASRLAHPGYPLADISLLFLLVAGVLIIAASRILAGPKFDQVVLALIALTGLGVFVLEIMAVSAYLASDFQYSYVESLIRFGHPRMYNHIQTWTLPALALLPAVFPDKAWLRLATPVLIGLQWQILFTTGARGSIISLVVAMAMLVLLAPRQCTWWLRYQVGGLLIGMIIFAVTTATLQVYQPGMDSFVEQSVGRTMTSSSGRAYLWELAVLDMRSSPLLGVGPAMFACDTPWPVSSSPHNLSLQVLSEWGALAFMLLGTTVAWVLFKLLAQVRTNNRPFEGFTDHYEPRVFICLAGCVLAATIHSQVSGLLIAPASRVTGMLILGWLWGLNCGNTQAQGDGDSRPGLALAFLVTALAVATSLNVFARSELRVLDHRTAYAVDYGPSAPRFWRDGRVCLYNFEEHPEGDG